MATEQYSIGYEEGFQNGWNAAVDSLPAQRKPLTDEQLSAIGSKIFPSTWNIRHVELVRAIEAAHGIKENK